jgi:hypothetical protein
MLDCSFILVFTAGICVVYKAFSANHKELTKRINECEELLGLLISTQSEKEK